MLMLRRIAPALIAGCLTLLAYSSQALAAEPATVTVRVEGLTETKLPATQVTTDTEPVVKDDNREHACSGVDALGALNLATSGNWSGPWNESFKQYEIYSIDGETHVFESGSSANYFWSFWLDDRESEIGACEAELHPGDQLLLFPACFGSACPPPSLPLGIEAPSNAGLGEPVTVTVKRYSATGAGAPEPGATVTGGDAPATTDAAGQATVTFSSAGLATLRVSAPESVRTEATLCVRTASNRECLPPSGGETPNPGPGNLASTGTSSTGTSKAAGGSAAFKSTSPPYTGPYAVVARTTGIIDGHVYPRGRAPRILGGTVSAHVPVTSVGLELRRTYRWRCSAYDGISERFRRARCGHGSFFKVASGASFSYLLPAPLAPGRYVLDLEATDAAGNHTTLARGTSRIVFYVR